MNSYMCDKKDALILYRGSYLNSYGDGIRRFFHINYNGIRSYLYTNNDIRRYPYINYNDKLLSKVIIAMLITKMKDDVFVAE